MEKQTFYLVKDRVRDNAIQAVKDAEHGSVISVSPPKRSLEQNGKFHALLTDIARSPMEWAGKRRTIEEWKALTISAHAVATNQAGEIIPGIEGEFVAIRESTAQMSVARASSLIEYVIAFCVQHGIEMREAKKQGYIPDEIQSSEAASVASDEGGESVVRRDSTPPDDPGGEPSPRSGEPSGSSSYSVSDAPSSSGASDEPEGVVHPSPTLSGSQNMKFNFGDGELVYLMEFAAKALRLADDSSLSAPAKMFDIEGMDVKYRAEVIKSIDGLESLAAMIFAINYVIEGKRTAAQARSYIARELLGCKTDELMGRQNG